MKPQTFGEHMRWMIAALAFTVAPGTVAAVQASQQTAAQGPRAWSINQIHGAWASAQDEQGCLTAPISLFMSDGSVIVFETAKGPLHSIGVWRVEGDTLFMTHTDVPLGGDGKSGPEAASTILQVTADRFVTRSASGRERSRVRCAGLSLPIGAERAKH